MEITLHDNEAVIINVKTPTGNSEYHLGVKDGRVVLTPTKINLKLTEKEQEIAREPARHGPLAHTGGKIPAIKAYRERTGASLLDAKNAVEEYLAHAARPNTEKPTEKKLFGILARTQAGDTFIVIEAATEEEATATVIREMSDPHTTAEIVTVDPITSSMWVAYAEEFKESFRLGKERIGNKLSEADMTRIRACHIAGISQAALAREYGVHSKTIRRVLTKKA